MPTDWSAYLLRYLPAAFLWQWLPLIVGIIVGGAFAFAKRFLRSRSFAILAIIALSVILWVFGDAGLSAGPANKLTFFGLFVAYVVPYASYKLSDWIFARFKHPH